MCNCDNFVTTDIHDKKLLKTRTPHKCVECGELLPKGTSMYRVTTLIEGYFSRHYTCLDCEEICKYITKIDPSFCYCYGELIETLIESYATSTRDIEVDAREEGIPSAVEGRGVVKGRYSVYRLNVPWLTPRIGGRFKLAIAQSERQTNSLMIE